MRFEFNHLIKNLILVLLLALPGITKASHIIGGEIQYRCLGGNDYEITVNVYRDCFFGDSDAPFDNPASIGIFDFNADTLVGDLRVPFLSDDTLDSFLADPCFIVPATVCVHTTTYRGTINLPYRPGGYTLVYQRCCRNQTINNIFLPDQTGATYSIVLSEEALTECNSSPEFKEWPPIFICAGTEINYDHSAFDLEGDSLVYSLCTPNTGATKGFPKPQPPLPPPYDTVEWLPGFNLGNILGSGRPLAIDSETGLLTGRPEIQGQFVVGICIEEYRDGELFSRTIRDFQYNVGQCGMITSTFQSPDALCDTLGVTLENDSDNADDFLWFFDWPNTNFTSTEEVPNFTYPDTGSYQIALIAQPGSSCADTSFADLFIQYNSLEVDFDATILNCVDSAQIILNDLSVDAVSPPVSWDWTFTLSNGAEIKSTDPNPVVNVPSNDTVEINLQVVSQNGCISEATKISPTDILDPSSDIPDEIRICQGESAALNPNGDSRFKHVWTPANTLNNDTLFNPIATPNTTTTYQVAIFADDQFCTIAKDVEVIVQPNPSLDFDYELGCDNRTVTFTNTSTGATDFEWNFGDAANTTSTDFNPEFVYTPGTYEVALYLANSNTCRDTIVRTVEVTDRGLDADFTVEYENCSPGNLVVNFNQNVNSNGHNIIEYNWNFGGSLGAVTGSDQQITFTTSQNIDVELEIVTAQGCRSLISKNLDINLVEIFPDGNFQLCAADSLELNPNFNPDYTYEWSPTTGLSDPNSPNPKVSVNSPQNYTVQISAFGVDTCEVLHNVEIFVPPVINLSVSDDDITCDSFATIFANTTANATIEWFDGSGSSVGTGDNITVPVSGRTNYMVVAEDGFGCSQTDFVAIAGGPVEVDMPADQQLCIGEPFSTGITNLDLNDNLQYAWSPSGRIVSGANTSDPVIDTSPGNFDLFVNIVSQFGCTYEDTINMVFVDPAPMDFDFEFQCDGLTVEFENLTPNGFDYRWNFGDLNVSSDTSSTTSPSYTYPAVDDYWVLLSIPYDVSCRDSVLKRIELGDIVLQADYEVDYIDCSEDSVTVQFTNTSFSLQNNVTNLMWDFGSLGTFPGTQNPTFTFSSDASVDVSLLIENAADCSDEKSETIDLDLFDLTGFPDQPWVQCENQTIFLNPNGNPDYIYEWSPANLVDDPTAVNPEFVGTADATIFVRILNLGVDTCEVTRQVEVQVPQPIRISNADDTQTCGFPILLTPSFNVPFNFEWTTGGGASLGNDPVILVNPTDSEIYIVEGTDNFGCGFRDSIEVTNRQVDISGNGPGGVCQNADASLSIDNLDSGDNLTNIEWMPADRIVNGQGTQNVEVNTSDAGTNIFRVITENQFGCLDTTSFVMGIGAFDPGQNNSIEICADVETNIYPDFNPAQQYQWIPATGLDDPNNPNPRATLTNDITYQAVVTEMVDTLTCIDTIQVDVAVRAPVQLQVTPSDTLCEQQVVTVEVITPITGLDYEWSLTPDFTDIIDNQRQIFINSTGVNTFYVRAFSQDSLECQYGGSVMLAMVPIDLEFDADTTLCLGIPEEITIENQSSIQDLTFDWSPTSGIISGANTNSPTVDVSALTTFTVDVENQFGCQETYDVNVSVSNLDDLNVVGEVAATPDSILMGQTSQLEAPAGYSYSWSPAGSLDDDMLNDPIAMPEETEEYTVTIEDEFGCITTRTVTVVVFDPLCVEPYIFLPNAFSPNGDRNNDILKLEGQFVEEMQLIIFDRWGQKVFESRDQSFGWDGTFKGEELSPDTYGFYLTVKCIDGEEFFKKGNISLLR